MLFGRRFMFNGSEHVGKGNIKSEASSWTVSSTSWAIKACCSRRRLEGDDGHRMGVMYPLDAAEKSHVPCWKSWGVNISVVQAVAWIWIFVASDASQVRTVLVRLFGSYMGLRHQVSGRQIGN